MKIVFQDVENKRTNDIIIRKGYHNYFGWKGGIKLADVDVKKVEETCRKIDEAVKFNEIDIDSLVKSLEDYCFITRSIPVYRSSYLDVILDLATREMYLETREKNIIIDYMLLKRINTVYDIIDEYNESL